MDVLIIKSNNNNDLKLLKELLNKMGLQFKSLSEEEIEDFGLSMLMKEADRSKSVSRESVMEKFSGD